MTIWIFNPPESSGQPTQPKPRWDGGIEFGLNLYTAGKCGQCAACPKYWRFDFTSYLLPEIASGRIYLTRSPYIPDNGLHPVFGAGYCFWTSKANPYIADANKLDVNFYGSWDLAFVEEGEPVVGTDFRTPGDWWVLRPPNIFNTLPYWGAPPDVWACLSTNRLIRMTPPEFGGPDYIDIEPFFP